MIPPKENGEFVARMERVLEVYKRPYDPLYPVLCMNRRIDTVEELRAETQAWQRRRDNSGSCVDGQFTDADARIKLKRLYSTLDE